MLAIHRASLHNGETSGILFLWRIIANAAGSKENPDSVATLSVPDAGSCGAV
jgi:hypothetical protein